MIPDELWPRLSERFGLHPRDWYLPPEEGGLTYGQWHAYLEAIGEPTQYPVPVWLVKPPVGGERGGDR